MSKRGFKVAYSTVAGWFNGNRGVRSMEHLKALCAVLRTDLNALTDDEIEIAQDSGEAAFLRELRKLTPKQREAIVAIMRVMK